MSENILEESTYYQYILRKGALRHGRQVMLRQGRLKFSEPDAGTIARVEAVEDLDTLDRLSERLLLVGSWQELFESS